MATRNLASAIITSFLGGTLPTQTPQPVSAVGRGGLAPPPLNPHLLEKTGGQMAAADFAVAAAAAAGKKTFDGRAGGGRANFDWSQLYRTVII